MSVAEVKKLPILNFQDIPDCLRDLANKVESGQGLENVTNVLVLVTEGGDIHPSIYSFGSFDAIRDVGMMQSAIHAILDCREPFRPQMEKTK